MLLVIESSADFPSVCLVDDKGNTIHSLKSDREKSHAELLPVFVQEAIVFLNSRGNSLHAVAVNEGPGSYTGLRIGLSLAKGLCFGLNIPLIAVSGLTAMLQFAQKMYPQKIAIFAMLDARRNEVYLQTLKNQALSPIEACILTKGIWNEQQEEALFIGNANKKAVEILDWEKVTCVEGPDAEQLAGLAYQKWQHNEVVSTVYFEPFYLKEFEAGISKKFAL